MTVAVGPPEPTLARAYRFTVKQYSRMVEVGILTVNDRVELLEGLILNKPPRSPRHNAVTCCLMSEVIKAVGDAWTVWVRAAITLKHSKPEPDLAIVRNQDKVYFKRHPLAREAALVVEVGDAALEEWGDFKNRLYASASIPAYWLVNLVERRVEVYTAPKAGRSPAYRRRQDYSAADLIPLRIAGQDFARFKVKQLLLS